MAIEVYRAKIRGIRKLLCHNAAQLANPMSDLSRRMKELTGLTASKKTEEHHKQIAQLEWTGGLYLDSDKRPIIPDTCLEGMLTQASRARRLGPKFESGVVVIDNPRIEHCGPKGATAADLLGDERFVDFRPVGINGDKKIMRTRPCFPAGWMLDFRIQIETEQVSADVLEAVLKAGGSRVGLGDYRPKFGLFEVVSFGPEKKR